MIMLADLGWLTSPTPLTLVGLSLAVVVVVASWIILLNLSVRRKIEIIRRRLEREAGVEKRQQQAQRMEAIGRLAGGVAHSFNNYLTSILGFSELLLESLPTKDLSRDGIEAIHKAAQRGTEFTRQLYALSRKQSLQLEILNLNSVVEGLEPALRGLAGDRLQLSLDLAEQLGSVRTDKAQIEQVITVFVQTARDAGAEGGRVTIETRNADFSEPFVQDLCELKPGPYVRLSISDNGAGMDENTRLHIFEPFFLPKQKSRGSGLALAMAYSVVRQSNGNIAVASEVGKGTTFSIYYCRE
jgi:two-component system cell cycle sensor histidine kinase/response regulator CckA